MSLVDIDHQHVNDNAISVDVECKHCGRFLFRAVGTVVIEGMICTNSKCKAKLNIKIVTPQSELKSISYKFESAEEAPKAMRPAIA